MVMLLLLVFLLVAVNVVLEYQSTGAAFNILYFVECIIGSNMAIYINNNHILYYHMDAYRYIMLGCNTSSDYLVIQGWIRTTLLYSAIILLQVLSWGGWVLQLR